MINFTWEDTIDALAVRALTAAHAHERVQELKAAGTADEPLLAAIAISKTYDAALLRAASVALHRRADGLHAPRWLPRPRLLPGGAAPRWWREAVNRSAAGIWKAIPQPGPERRLGPPDSPLVRNVTRCAQDLQASLRGHRTRTTFYEAYEPDGQQVGSGTAVPPLSYLGPAISRRLNLWLSTGRGVRIPPEHLPAFRQANDDYHAVWDRSRAYAEAVHALLRTTP